MPHEVSLVGPPAGGVCNGGLGFSAATLTAGKIALDDANSDVMRSAFIALVVSIDVAPKRIAPKRFNLYLK